VSTVPTAAGAARELVASRQPHGKRRLLLAGAVLLVAVLGAAGAVLATGRFVGSGSPNGGVTDNGSATTLQLVTQGPLTQQTSVSATIAYTGSYSVVNQASGTITALPTAGQIVAQGEVLYGVGGAPVVLLLGATPAHRGLQEGMSGADVAELNADLVALDLATPVQLNPASDYFSAATALALEHLQANLGLNQNGILALGQAVFLPTAARITTVSPSLGATVVPGQPVLQATSPAKLVVVQLDAALQTGVEVGDPATITLPDNQTTPGTVSNVGTVATSTSGASGSNETATVEVDITLDDPAATGDLDQAPVQVAVITARVDNAYIVPVNALLALAGGGYAVETVDARGVHHLLPVTLGLFDDGDGTVQISGSGISAGLQVVVPST